MTAIIPYQHTSCVAVLPAAGSAAVMQEFMFCMGESSSGEGSVNLQILGDLVDSVGESCNMHLLLPPQKHVGCVCLEIGIGLSKGC